MSTTPSAAVVSPHTALKRTRRLKVAVACQNCRNRKVKCDGGRPACSNCQKKHTRQGKLGRCSYHSPGPTTAQQTPSPSRNRAPFASDDDPGPPVPPKHELAIAHDGSVGAVPGTFASDINAAVTTRLGPPSAERPDLISTVDVPLFGVLDQARAANNGEDVETVIPPRKRADYLVDIYWTYVFPLEPLLDRRTFSQSYQALFEGALPENVERIFLSTLNTIFAISMQVQESLAPQTRDETSKTYFHRAWALLQPATAMWEPASLGLVQCLLLMSRYLQCTGHSHRTWMVVGCAVRVAQSLGLDAHDTSTSTEPIDDTFRRREKLWQCCVFMDRSTSWTFGRVSTIPLAGARTDLNPGHDDGLEGSVYYFAKTLELYEIANSAMNSQKPTSSSPADYLGLSSPNRTSRGSIGTVLHLEDCIKNWERYLPQDLNLDDSEENPENRVDNVLYRQKILLRLRLFHARIVIFKSMLARYCLSSHQAPTAVSTDLEPAPEPAKGLSDRVFRECASICVENAQQMIQLVHREHMQGANIGILPWWHRVFYLHVAGTVLIAAMLQPDLYTPSVSQCWTTAMIVLRAHSHLSAATQQCVVTFQALSTKILETQHQVNERAALPDDGGSSNGYFQDIFQGIDSSLLFGEDMAWIEHQVF